MYVCICKAVSESRVRAAIAQGACSLSELKSRLGLGTCCGRCVPAARELLCDAAPLPLDRVTGVAGAVPAEVTA